MESTTTFTAFEGQKRIAVGLLQDVLPVLKRRFDADPSKTVLVFEDETGRQVEFDLRGTLDEVIARESPTTPRGRGRPKLGVISREVSLLPRHWEWLDQQPSGISAALRRLVDQARKAEPGKEKARQIRAATSRFMWAMAGDLPGYEETSRALFAGDHATVDALTKKWPKDIRKHVVQMSKDAYEADEVNGTDDPR